MKTRPLALVWLGGALLIGYAIVALFAPVLAPYDPRLPVGPPLASPTPGQPLGTNDLGQDVLSQLISGARSSLLVATLVTLVSTALSWLVGLLAGFFQATEAPLMALTDLLLALPGLPLSLLLLTLIGPDRRTLVLVLALLSWPAFARLVRSVVIGTRGAPFVEASRALGATGPHIALRHILPATRILLPAKLVLTVRFAIFAEATLAFLGLGPANAVSWGLMLNWAFADPLLFNRPVWPWLVLPPTIAITALILATVWVSAAFSSIRQPLAY